MDRYEAFNSISHLICAVAALVGAAVLVVFASVDGDPRRIVSFSIYGTTLFFLYLMSTLYHSTQGRKRRLFKFFDHQAIYLLIAGTYPPFALATLRDVTGWWLYYALGRRVAWAHGVWQVFVLAGSAFHYVAILFYV